MVIVMDAPGGFTELKIIVMIELIESLLEKIHATGRVTTQVLDRCYERIQGIDRLIRISFLPGNKMGE